MTSIFLPHILRVLCNSLVRLIPSSENGLLVALYNPIKVGMYLANARTEEKEYPQTHIFKIFRVTNNSEIMVKDAALSKKNPITYNKE